MRVKICGITNVADAQAAADAGADAIGLNFVAGPRRIDLDRAREILEHLPPLVTPVALVRIEDDNLDDSLAELLGEFWVSHLQLYGQVTPRGLERLKDDGFRPIPVVPVKDEHFALGPPVWMTPETGDLVGAVVLDAFDPACEGGTGKTLRWDWVAAARRAGQLDHWPWIILAGGLSPENVAEAIRVARPYAVDVSSGVELSGSPGRKDHARVRAFVTNALAAQQGPS